MFTVPDCC